MSQSSSSPSSCLSSQSQDIRDRLGLCISFFGCDTMPCLLFCVEANKDGRFVLNIVLVTIIWLFDNRLRAC
jgi:hypothetical protein